MTHTPILPESPPVDIEGLKPILPLRRLNPATGVPFRRGDLRADGYKFKGYDAAISKKTGLLYETWLTPERLKQVKNQAKDYQAKYRKEHPEKVRNCGIKYYKANVAKVAARQAKYAKANSGEFNARNARRRAAKLLRTPPWLTKEQRAEIEAVYVLCAERTRVTGIPHAVDHILPLQGRTVSGLHIAANLQIILASENCSKNNRYVQE
jgi:hypothetical protein